MSPLRPGRWASAGFIQRCLPSPAREAGKEKPRAAGRSEPAGQVHCWPLHPSCWGVANPTELGGSW